MKTLLSGLMAAALAASFAVALPMPADAAPAYVPKSEQMRTEQARPDVQKVHSKRKWRRAYRRHAYRYYDDDYYYGHPRYYRSYHGFRPHRYYRRHRPGITLQFNF
jgi:hypothetical protein